MNRRAPLFYGLLLIVAGFAMADGTPRRHHPKPGKKRSLAPTLSLASGNRLSLAALRAAAGASSPETAALTLRLVLRGGGKKTWVSENCNPVVPVVNGEMRPLRQCFTDFYARIALDQGRAEPFDFIWPPGESQRALKAGDSVRLMMTLATDCNKTGGPGLFALGDCKTREQILSEPFIVKE